MRTIELHCCPRSYCAFLQNNVELPEAMFWRRTSHMLLDSLFSRFFRNYFVSKTLETLNKGSNICNGCSNMYFQLTSALIPRRCDAFMVFKAIFYFSRKGNIKDTLRMCYIQSQHCSPTKSTDLNHMERMVELRNISKNHTNFSIFSFSHYDQITHIWHLCVRM
jgi:hypothetical protein